MSRGLGDVYKRQVKSGIDSISVNPDAVVNTKKMVAQIEQRIMLDAMTGRGRQESDELIW